jgi:hypothetical protein
VGGRNALRCPGISQGESVFVSPRLSGTARRFVLAHELAHVQQRWNAVAGSGPVAGEAALEQEAHDAALAVISGIGTPCRLADHGRTPRCWGVAGHYYTAYFVLMAAGLGNRKAYQMAFYAQMPDQVDELDATSAGIDIYSRSASVGMFGGAYRQPSADAMMAMMRDYDVQQGLHCLTGAKSDEETQRRRGVLESADQGSFEFGLAIHPFGDSFAHRVLNDPTRMYGPMLGHAVEALEGRDAHSPDFIRARPELYRQYGQMLYDIVCAKTPNWSRLLSRDALGSRLSDIARESGDGAQINAIRRYSEMDLCQSCNPPSPRPRRCRSGAGSARRIRNWLTRC